MYFVAFLSFIFISQEIPSKRRKRNKKTKPLQFVIPDEFMATSASCETETQIPDRVTAIGLYIKKLLIELKVSRKVFRFLLNQNSVQKKCDPQLYMNVSVS